MTHVTSNNSLINSSFNIADKINSQKKTCERATTRVHSIQNDFAI